ncbi:MAG: GNAT family N-acetyltransferase [Lachnospiraceae bacterium]|nr:GNAT family N-acetyltransferase [Ruminococcus sp.]MCM1276163.1 GNAT family N-acetyltransferase [Lachnospiraceae bacterium]
MIRAADIGDLERLAELFRELHSYHCGIAPNKHRMPSGGFFRERLSETLSDSGYTVLVNDDNGVNGYAVVKIVDVDSEEKPPRRVCFIDCFAVAEGCRRRGVGTELFGAVAAFGKERGCTDVQLGADACNADALAFYEKMGLSPRTVIMEKRI